MILFQIMQSFTAFRFHHFCLLLGLVGSSLLISPGQAQTPPPTRSRSLEQQLFYGLSQVSSPAAPQSSGWQSFASAPGHYIVDLPALPTQFTSTTEVPEGTLTWQVAEVRQAEARSENADAYEYYMVAYTMLSDDHLTNRNPDELVQSVSDAVLAEGGLTGSVQLQERIQFDTFPARLVIGETNDQYWVMIVSLVNGRLYTKLALSEQRDRVTHFFDSFQFTDFSN